jgi:hypothetical protein
VDEQVSGWLLEVAIEPPKTIGGFINMAHPEIAR